MLKRKRAVALLLILALAAGVLAARRHGRMRGLLVRMLPENTGDYAGPLTRATFYDPAKPPSRPWLDPQRAAPPLASYQTYKASSIGGEETYYILYLPPGYGDSINANHRYPVIYWLHGFYVEPQHGSPFIDALDAAIRARQIPPTIAVLPNGLHHSWYVDSVDGSQPVESVIINDLIPHIDRSYRTIPDRRARAVEGFSMGGWGAGHLALKYPDLFGAVTMMCAPFHKAVTFPQLPPIFSGSAEAYYAEDPVTRARRHADQLRGRVAIRLLDGGDDYNLRFNQNFHQRLTEWNIPHEFVVVPGIKHDDAGLYQHLGPAAFAFYAPQFLAAKDAAAVPVPAAR